MRKVRALEKISTTVGSETYLRIKRDIIFGDLAPGTKLKLNGLKERYETSMSTLRETLNRLASEGFVDALEQRGFFVVPVSAEDLTEIADLRILLECSALDASINQGDADWEGNLVAAHHKLHRVENLLLAGDFSNKEEWKKLDREFHLALIQACANANLLALHGVLYDKYLRYQMLVLTYRGAEAVAEHQAIFDAAIKRDPQAASAALREHIHKGLVHTLEAMNSEWS
jgi:DNA-binding GntR family transcriptional regulator